MLHLFVRLFNNSLYLLCICNNGNLLWTAATYMTNRERKDRWRSWLWSYQCFLGIFICCWALTTISSGDEAAEVKVNYLLWTTHGKTENSSVVGVQWSKQNKGREQRVKQRCKKPAAPKNVELREKRGRKDWEERKWKRGRRESQGEGKYGGQITRKQRQREENQKVCK